MSRTVRLESVLAGGVLAAALAIAGPGQAVAQPQPVAPPPVVSPPVTAPQDDVEWGPVAVDPGSAVEPPAPSQGRPQPEGGDDHRLAEPLTPASPPASAPPPGGAELDPGFFDALPGPSVASGVPNFVIRKFRVPLFLLPIYQAAGIEYGIRWEVLAAINEIETDYGRNLNVSSAGALGWMQFMPPSWRAYGVDANKDGRKDPYNPVDAIFAAARYLAAANYENDVRGAIFAYNHADWYVDSVLLRAKLIAGVPADLVGSLTGLTEGHFPIAARARYVGSRHVTEIFAPAGSPVVATNDGVLEKVGESEELGKYIVLQDVYGNRYTYSGLGKIEVTDPVNEMVSSAQGETVLAKRRLFARPDLARRDGRRARAGMQVIGGTILGRVGKTDADKAAHVDFGIRPAGRGAPTIDPKPILDGWKLLEATAIYRAAGRNVLYGRDSKAGGLSVGQILLLPKPLLEKRVLSDERIEVYDSGRQDIQTGQIDRRVLATLAYLAESGLRPTVTSLKAGHSYLTASGNVSHHSRATRSTSPLSTASRSSATRTPAGSPTKPSGG
jgi:hypothetical protein